MKLCSYCGFYGEPHEERNKKVTDLFCARCGNWIGKTRKKKKRKEVQTDDQR